MEELVRATNNFSRGCLIGSGAFGNVYVGTFDVEGTLAIKKARADSYTSTHEFRNGKQQNIYTKLSEMRYSFSIFDMFI